MDDYYLQAPLSAGRTYYLEIPVCFFCPLKIRFRHFLLFIFPDSLEKTAGHLSFLDRGFFDCCCHDVFSVYVPFPFPFSSYTLIISPDKNNAYPVVVIGGRAIPSASWAGCFFPPCSIGLLPDTFFWDCVFFGDGILF
ncbi:MAG: hypothetical protein D3922_03130 [Candidatus Electrothrix sp. AR1]|nr:hypothetical protein [Candidatus Electrothrix sp. AR1]